jgi:hypothetical protein
MFDAVAHAKQEIAPLVAELCTLAEEEGRADQRLFFGRVLAALEAAAHTDDLAGPFMELSTSAFLGFAYSPPVALLLDRVLERAQHLSESLSLDPDALQ